MGNNPSEKLKKQVKSRILVLETKMKELMFWQETKNLTYTGEVDDKLPPRKFPEKDNVHYFHPLSWVRHMKLILGTGVPPWMDYLFEEFETYKGINENVSPLKERIVEYHNSGCARGNTHIIPWCASFVNWCFDQTEKYKDINSGLNSFAFDWGPEGNKLAQKK